MKAEMGTETKSDWIKPAKISELVFAVRYESQFRVMDHIGEIIDAVLRKKGTPFGPEVFPQTLSQPNEHILVNPENKALLRVTHQDAMLKLPLDTENADYVKQAADDYQNYILAPLRDHANLQDIMRYGMVLVLDSKSSSFKTPPIKRFMPKEFPDANNFILRFTRRLPADEGLFKKRVDDFRNLICTIEESEKSAVRISLDFQNYFLPLLNSSEWKDRPFPVFVAHSLAYFQREYPRWLQQLVGTAGGGIDA